MKFFKMLVFTLLTLTVTTALSQEKHFEKIISIPHTHQEVNQVLQCADGNFLITGYIDSAHKNISLMKVDNNGDTIWTRSYGAENVDDSGYDMVVTNNGYAVCGETRSYATNGQADAFILNIDENGKWKEYPKVFGGRDTEIATRIIKVRDNNLAVIVEKRINANYTETYVYKVDQKGNRIWTASLPNYYPIFGASIFEEVNGDIIFGGTSTNQLEKDRDILIAKISGSDGQLKWHKVITGQDNYNESLQSIVKSKTGNYYLTGMKLTPARRYLFFYVIDSEGNIKVDKLYNFGEEKFSLSSPKNMIESKDGNIIIVGEKSGRGFLLKLSPAGERISFRSYGGLLSSVVELTNGDLMIVGRKRNELNRWDAYIIRSSNDGRLE